MTLKQIEEKFDKEIKGVEVFINDGSYSGCLFYHEAIRNLCLDFITSQITELLESLKDDKSLIITNGIHIVGRNYREKELRDKINKILNK